MNSSMPSSLLIWVPATIPALGPKLPPREARRTAPVSGLV